MIPRKVLKAFLLQLLREQWPALATAAFDVSLYTALGFATWALWRNSTVPLWVAIVVTVTLADGWKMMATGWVKGALLMRSLNKHYPAP